MLLSIQNIRQKEKKNCFTRLQIRELFKVACVCECVCVTCTCDGIFQVLFYLIVKSILKNFYDKAFVEIINVHGQDK